MSLQEGYSFGVYLDSDQRISGDAADCIFDNSHLEKLDYRVIPLSIQNIVIPEGMYLVNEGKNDTFILAEYTSGVLDAIQTCTLTPGNYSGSSLATEIVASITPANSAVYTCTHGNSTGKNTLATSGTKTFILSFGSNSASRIMGFSNASPSAEVASLISTYVCDLDGPNTIEVRSNNVRHCLEGNKGVSNIIASIPIKDLYRRITYTSSKGDLIYYLAGHSFDTGIHIRLTVDYHNGVDDGSNIQSVNLNGRIWSIGLLITETHKHLK